MPTTSLSLNLLPVKLAVCRLPADATLPDWAQTGKFFTLTRTADELSIVCSQSQVPTGTQAESGWRALQVDGPLDFSLTGILAVLAAPLAEAGISIFAISTYDTDYILVKDADLERAVGVLSRAGHRTRDASESIE